MGSRAYDDQRLGPAKCVERADETPSYAGSFNDSEPPTRHGSMEIWCPR
jgi:hypothetical protein